MSYINYCINLTEEEKLEIDKQVRKNRFELRFAIFFPFLPVPIVPMPQVPFLPVEGFSPQQIVRNARDRVQSAVEERLRPLAQLADDCQEAYNEYKVYSAEAKSSGLPGAEGFPPTPPAHSRPANKGSGLFNQPKPQNQNPGSDKPGGNGGGGGGNNNDNSKSEPQCIPQSDPVKPWQFDYQYQSPSDSDTEASESESDWSEDSDWDKDDFAKILTVFTKDNNKVLLDRKQFRDKAHHLDVFPNVKIPKTFDLDYLKSLDYKSRLEYVRDRSKLPEEVLFDAQREASKHFRATKTESFSGMLGRKEIPGTLYINESTRTVAFVNIKFYEI